MRQIEAVGIPWYFRQDYGRILQIMEDADLLPARYDQWLKKAEALERKLKRDGMIVVRAIVEPDEFPRWCASKGLNVDANGRNNFASEVAYQVVGKTH